MEGCVCLMNVLTIAFDDDGGCDAKSSRQAIQHRSNSSVVMLMGIACCSRRLLPGPLICVAGTAVVEVQPVEPVIAGDAVNAIQWCEGAGCVSFVRASLTPY